MDRHVHYELTRQWAVEAGFSLEDAEKIAAADWAVDSKYFVHANWHNKGYHFAWLGARRRARRFLALAVDGEDLVALGEGLHCVQDAIGHGNLGHLYHWDGIDRWELRSRRVRDRLESASRQMLDDYRSALLKQGARSAE